MSLTEIIFSRLDYLRTKKGVSVNTMLKECGLQKSVIDNLKKNCFPSIEIIYKLAVYFDISIDYIVGREKTKNPAIENDDGDIDNTFFNEFKELSPSQKAIVEDEMKALKLKS